MPTSSSVAVAMELCPARVKFKLQGRAIRRKSSLFVRQSIPLPLFHVTLSMVYNGRLMMVTLETLYFFEIFNGHV